MKFWNYLKANTSPSVVVSVVVGTAVVGVVGFALKKLKIAPVTKVVNVASKGSAK